MTNLAERRRKMRERLRQKRLEQQKLKEQEYIRLPFMPKQSVEYGCPNCRIIIYPEDWFIPNIWIHYKHQPETCPRCGAKLEKIENEKLLAK